MEYTITSNNLHIVDSYKISNTESMRNILNKIYNESVKNNISVEIFEKRTIDSMIEEWKTHNLFYDFRILRSHTKDVDINLPSKFWLLMYKFFSKLYI